MPLSLSTYNVDQRISTNAICLLILGVISIHEALGLSDAPLGLCIKLAHLTNVTNCLSNEVFGLSNEPRHLVVEQICLARQAQLVRQ